MKKWQERAIKEIMDEFDFAQVHKAMVALDWVWGTTDTAHIPSIKELRIEAKRQLTELCENGHSAIDCAGFYSTYDKKNKHLKLSFIIESWSVSKSDLL
jgi:hypothetical protein